MSSRYRWIGWAASAVPVLALAIGGSEWPRWGIMWLLAAAIYFACKQLTWSAATTDFVPVWRQWAYWFAWPGMDAGRFFSTDASRGPQPLEIREWTRASVTTICGVIIFWNAQRVVDLTSPLVIGWAGMIGTILVLHFGLFQLLSCLWRSVGIDARPLMNAPLQSTGVAQFWGRRWNTAFRDLTYQFLFRPLRRRWGPIGALLVGFFVSGLVHEVVISIPAGGGYGGPTVFFCIQAVAILFERSAAGAALGLGGGWQGWLFTALVLLLPVRLLFHDPFIVEIVVPFMKALGAA